MEKLTAMAFSNISCLCDGIFKLHIFTMVFYNSSDCDDCDGSEQIY